MSIALYRKYRPADFSGVVGQDHVTEPLQHALRSGHVHHAYLFSGPRGCGKTSSARILARSLNCEQGPTPVPCGECDSCVALAPNGPGSLDVIEIDAASHGGVDDARDLRERAFFAPVSSRYKIYVIDEAHMVSREGFNALLKVVEEPPPHLKFVFATTEPEKVLPTIKSRTFHYRFRLVPPNVMREHLAGICAREGIEVDPLVLPLVVRAGGGSVRDALSVLDQLVAGAGPDGLTYAAAVATLGFTDAALLDEVVDAFAAGDGATVFRVVDRVVEAGIDPKRFVTDLLERFRDLIVLDAVPDAAESGLLDRPGDLLDRMRSQATRFGRGALVRAADVLDSGLVDMRGTTSPRLMLELLAARVLLPAADSDEAAVHARLDRLERRLAVAPAPVAAEPPPAPAPARAEPASAPEAPAPAATAPVEAPPPSPAAPADPPAATPPAAPSSAAGALDAAAVRRVWEDVLENVRASRRYAWSLLKSNAQVAAVEGNRLVLSFSSVGAKKSFTEHGVDILVQEALREVIGADLQVVAGDGEGAASGPPARENDPPAAVSRPAAYDVPPDVDLDDEPAGEPQAERRPPDEAAIDLLGQELGATVIGEIDAS